MKIKKILLAIALSVAALDSSAMDGWRNMEGSPIPDSPSVRSSEGFGAMLLITSDKDWQEKWNTSPDTVPHFSEATDVNEGGELFILPFLSNPALDESGMTNVTCDFVITRPDGSKNINELGMPCFVTRLASDPRNVYLSSAALKYLAEPTDLRGMWVVDVTLRDNVRNVQLPLKASFTVH